MRKKPGPKPGTTYRNSLTLENLVEEFREVAIRYQLRHAMDQTAGPECNCGTCDQARAVLKRLGKFRRLAAGERP